MVIKDKMATIFFQNNGSRKKLCCAMQNQDRTKEYDAGGMNRIMNACPHIMGLMP
jgi:hypothetical protein